MDLSNNELFQMLLTDMINMNNQILNNNDNGNMFNNTYIYNNENILFNNIQNGIHNEIRRYYGTTTVLPSSNSRGTRGTAVPNNSVRYRSLRRKT